MPIRRTRTVRTLGQREALLLVHVGGAFTGIHVRAGLWHCWQARPRGKGWRTRGKLHAFCLHPDFGTAADSWKKGPPNCSSWLTLPPLIIGDFSC